jgi:hypothetical protein
MAWTTPGTATAGEVLTAAFWNANVRDNSLALRDNTGTVPDAVKCFTNATQTIPATTVTKIAFAGADDFDTNNLHSPSTNNTRVTIQKTGIYLISGSVQYGTSIGGYGEAGIAKNGAVASAGFLATMIADSTTGTIISVSTVAQLAASDYIELYVYLTNGKTTANASPLTYLSAVMLAATS